MPSTTWIPWLLALACLLPATPVLAQPLPDGGLMPMPRNIPAPLRPSIKSIAQKEQQALSLIDKLLAPLTVEGALDDEASCAVIVGLDQGAGRLQKVLEELVKPASQLGDPDFPEDPKGLIHLRVEHAQRSLQERAGERLHISLSTYEAIYGQAAISWRTVAADTHLPEGWRGGLEALHNIDRDPFATPWRAQPTDTQYCTTTNAAAALTRVADAWEHFPPCMKKAFGKRMKAMVEDTDFTEREACFCQPEKETREGLKAASPVLDRLESLGLGGKKAKRQLGQMLRKDAAPRFDCVP